MSAGVPDQSYDSLFAAPTNQMVDITGKRAIITGSSSGIGKATACTLAAAGVNLILVARREDKLQEIKAEIEKRQLPVTVEVMCGDVTSDELYTKMKEANCLEKVDFLINNAGLARGKDPISSAVLADWAEMMNANCNGAFRMAREVLPGMVAQGSGHVISTGSIAGLEAYENGSVYCASKHALHAFMKVMRYETYSKNIRVTTVAPGFVGEGTEFSAVRFKGDMDAVAKVYENMEELKATDVAAQIVWALRQPANVNLDMIHIMPTCQGGATRIHRAAPPS